MTFRMQNIRQSEKRKRRKEAVQAVFEKLRNSFAKGEQKIEKFAQQAPHFLATHRQKKLRWRWIVGAFGIILGVFVVFETSTRVWNFFQNFELKDLLWVIGSDLPTDEYGMTNILLLGVGGDDHTAGTLTDSILIASIDYDSRSVSLLSIPRDFYIETQQTAGRVNSVIADVIAGYPRDQFDTAYNAGVAVLKEALEDIFEIQIHRYAQIDFSGFAEGVDALGGIDVEVDETIDDYSYPSADWDYEHFYLPTGLQHLDGATALKYVRSRYGSSDFERSRRQRKLLEAIQQKAISAEILTSPKKLQELYAIVQDNTKTDLEWREIISLGNVGYNFPRENIFSFGLNNDETKPGGFLVTPDRDLYGGAFVLVPFLNLTNDKYARIRVFAENIFRHRELLLREVQIRLLNGTQITGLAGETAVHLERLGIPIAGVDNSVEKIEDTIIRFYEVPQARTTAEMLQGYFPAELEALPVPESDEENPSSGPDLETITVIIGRNHTNYRIPEPAAVPSERE